MGDPFFFFFCKSTSGPSGVQTLHPGNASVKLLQLSNRKHCVKSSLETSIQTILPCLQVAGGRFAPCNISLFKRVREGCVKCSVSSPGTPLPSHLSAFSIWLWHFLFQPHQWITDIEGFLCELQKGTVAKVKSSSWPSSLQFPNYCAKICCNSI